MTTTEQKDWQSRPEAGSTRALRLLLWIAQRVNRRVLHAVLYPITTYFYLVRKPERCASRNFLNRVLPKPATRLDVWRHFLSFAKVTADRFYFLVDGGSNIPITFIGEDALKTAMDRGGAGIFLAAHFGSFESARVVGPQFSNINLRIVLEKSVSGRILEILKEVNPEMIDNIIDSDQGSIALGLSIANALRDGDWVGFLADRHRPNDRVMSHNFLGDTAQFPIGPYIIANTVNAPVIGVFCRVTAQGYEVHCEVLSEAVKLDRKHRQSQLQALSASYVERLEHHVRAAPFGWFNFFDFWATQESIQKPTDRPNVEASNAASEQSA